MLFLRSIYLGSVFGIGALILPSLWALATLGVALYFYSQFSALIRAKIGFPVSISDFLGFSSIVLVSGIGQIFTRIFAPLQKPAALSWGAQSSGVLLGLIRAMTVSALVCMMLILLPVGKINTAVRTSVLGRPVIDAALIMYTKCHNALVTGRQKTADQLFQEIDKDKDYIVTQFSELSQVKWKTFKPS